MRKWILTWIRHCVSGVCGGFLLLAALSISAQEEPKTTGVADYQALVDSKLWITENYPPYHYMTQSDNGKSNITGLVIRLLEEIFARNQLEFDPDTKFVMFPWARAVKELSTNPDAVVVSMGYSEQRKNLFRLSEPVIAESIGLIALQQRKFAIYDANEISNLIIGTVRDDIAERLLKDSTEHPLNITYVQSSDELLQMLIKNRVDMIAYSKAIIDYQITRHSLEIKDFQLVSVLAQIESAIAFNRDGEKALFELINHTIRQMRADGTIELVINGAAQSQ